MFQEFNRFYANFWRERVMKRGVDAAQIELLFRQFDKDGLGEISGPVFKHVCAKCTIMMVWVDLNMIFFVSIYMQAMKTYCPRLSDADLDEMIAHIDDSNGDGLIDYHEFIAYLDKNLAPYEF
jgi:Ca2+-binding EF-hand superfamily protein